MINGMPERQHSPTMQLRWSASGKLQQLWRKETHEQKQLAGHPTPLTVTNVDEEWRDVPTEKLP